MNNFTATGNLGSDCEVRTAGQSTVCTFSLPIKSGFGKNEKTSWMRCQLWGKRAEGRLPDFLVKGCAVCVSGEISLNTWEGTDGTEKTSLECNIANLDLIGGKGQGGGNQSQQQDNDPFPEQQSGTGGTPQTGTTGQDVPFAPCFC